MNGEVSEIGCNSIHPPIVIMDASPWTEVGFMLASFLSLRAEPSTGAHFSSPSLCFLKEVGMSTRTVPDRVYQHRPSLQDGVNCRM